MNPGHSLDKYGRCTNKIEPTIAKDSDSGTLPRNVLILLPGLRVHNEECVMTEKTCAACDYPLDANAIKVEIGGKTVEVCCEECAQKLQEARASAAKPGKG